ncbi:NfeD family protein [Serratia marcescens]|uniref:NfeD family protein n=1 Tax=Serratia TaxID=613 RepID=UPI0018D9F72F|nr:NfeD family protein [Serratia marcescens]MBH2868973.1 NfeD family protein [Serratia marcescens]BEM81094.1 membrane protein [Serratia marcescens]HEB0100680.1 NfeD family protein [Serratia marcescens]
MLELIAANPLWFWLSLGGVLLAAEMLGAGGYLLWSGVAALLVGALIWLLPPLSWAWQGMIFAVLTVVVAYLWWYWLRRRPATASGGSPVLNQRNRQLIGTRATLTEPMHNGMGRINIGDSSWRAQAAEDLPAGTEVEVVAVEGVTLVIRALPSSLR